MKSLFLLGVLVLTFTTLSFAQFRFDDTPLKGSDLKFGDEGASGQLQQTVYVRPDSKTRFSRYVKNIVGLEAFAKIIGNAGIGTARNSPREWGPHWEGFGKRVASEVGKNVIRSSVTFALDETFKLDSHFYRSQKRSVGLRLMNAVVSSVTARNKEGKRVPGFPRIAGIYSSHIIAAETWYPARYSYKNGLKSGTISLGMTAVFNLVREFVRR